MEIRTRRRAPFPSSWLGRGEDHLIRDALRRKAHLLEDRDQGIVFIPDSLSVFECPKPLERALNGFLHGVPRAQATRSQNLPASDFDAFLLSLLRDAEPRGGGGRLIEEKRPEGAGLDRLVLNVSHACNLRCRYCYAGGGNYDEPRGLMTEATAAGVLDRFFGLFDRIGRIQFFGGEPLLNAGLIRFACERIADMARAGRIAEPPKFGLVTNGTILSPEIMDLLSRHAFHVNVSLDGAAGVNDELRGQGTFDKVARFVEALERRGVDVSFEATYTAEHLRQGITVCELMDFFHDRFGAAEVHIPPVSLPEGHPLALVRGTLARVYGDAVAYSVSNLRPGGRRIAISFASRMMSAFLDSRPVRPYCPAGTGTLSVDFRGRVYPCFMFTGMDRFCLGSVFDGSVITSSRALEILNRFGGRDKTEDPRCRGCWALPLCSGCYGADLAAGKGKIGKLLCDMNKAMAERFIKSVAAMFGRGLEPPAEIAASEGGGQPWASL